jgi:hypothetical protein
MPGGYSGKSSVRCELKFDDGSAKTCLISYESFPRIATHLAYVDLGTFDPWADPRAGSADQQPTSQTHVSLFAPVGRTIPSLRSIQSPQEIETTVVGQPEISIMGNVQRAEYKVRFAWNLVAMRAAAGTSFAKPVTFLSDAGHSTVVTVAWHQVERYRYAPSPVFFGTAYAGGSPRNLAVVITSSAKSPIAIKSIKSDSEYLAVRLASASSASRPGGNQTLTFVLSVPAAFDQGDALSGTVRIVLAEGDSLGLAIPWSAFVRRRTVPHPGGPTVPKDPKKDQ